MENLQSFEAVILGLFLFLLYLLPTGIAQKRHHPNTASIFIVNLFLGWTFLGWVICCAWAFSQTQAAIKQN